MSPLIDGIASGASSYQKALDNKLKRDKAAAANNYASAQAAAARAAQNASAKPATYDRHLAAQEQYQKTNPDMRSFFRPIGNALNSVFGVNSPLRQTPTPSKFDIAGTYGQNFANMYTGANGGTPDRNLYGGSMAPNNYFSGLEDYYAKRNNVHPAQLSSVNAWFDFWNSNGQREGVKSDPWTSIYTPGGNPFHVYPPGTDTFSPGTNTPAKIDGEYWYRPPNPTRLDDSLPGGGNIKDTPYGSTYEDYYGGGYSGGGYDYSSGQAQNQVSQWYQGMLQWNINRPKGG